MKTNLLRIAVAIAVAVTSVVIIACSREAGTKIVIKGSTTVLPITQKAAEAFKRNNPDVSISIEGSGSGNGIKALIDGSCEIANASRAMKPKEIKKAQDKGINAKEITVGIDMIVPVVHTSNPVQNITMAQLKGIYDGTITNWKDLGGNDEKIVVISRDTSSGTYEVWQSKVLNKADVRSDALLQASNGAVVSSVSENPKAIGYIGFGYMNDSIKALNVNSIEPTIENGKSGRYPVSRSLYMYINPNKISEAAQKFVDFILSDDGQALVKEAGYIPLN